MRDDGAFRISLKIQPIAGYIGDPAGYDISDEYQIRIAQRGISSSFISHVQARMEGDSNGWLTIYQLVGDKVSIPIDVTAWDYVRFTTQSTESGTFHCAGYYTDYGTKKVNFADGPNLDAFGRLRVAAPTVSLFDSQMTFDLQPLIFDQKITGSGASIAHDTTNRCALVTFSSTPTGGEAIMESFEHFRYQPGKSQLINISFNFIEAVANCLKFVGYCDGNEGIRFELNGTTKQFKLQSDTDAGDVTVTQSNWNLDPLDGTGPSGITLDITKTQIFICDLQALYVGRVRVGFDIDGKDIYCHEFLHANRSTFPYISHASQPIRAGMTCTGTVSTTMRFICSSVTSEGGQDDSVGYHFSQEGVVTAASGARTHALSLEHKPTFNSLENHGRFVMESVNILAGSNPVYWELVIGQAITGTTTMNSVNAQSIMNYNSLGTLSGSPTLVADSGYVASSAVTKGEVNTQVPFKYPISLDMNGAVRLNGRLTLLLTGIGGTSACRVAINWKEIR